MWLFCFNNSLIALRCVIPSRPYKPCLCALRLRLGAPGDVPPCMRHRFLPLIAGDWQGVPWRVFAPQRGLVCMGNLLCMGLFPCFCATSPLCIYVAHYGLSAGVDMHMLNRHLLLAFAPVFIEGFHQCRISAGQFIGVV